MKAFNFYRDRSEDHGRDVCFKTYCISAPGHDAQIMVYGNKKLTKKLTKYLNKLYAKKTNRPIFGSPDVLRKEDNYDIY